MAYIAPRSLEESGRVDEDILSIVCNMGGQLKGDGLTENKVCILASDSLRRKGNGKEAYLYSAFYIPVLCISQSAQAWITQFYLQIHHACLSFICVHQMAPPLR